VLDRDDLINLVTPILNANTPAGYIPIDNTIMIKQITNPIIEEDGNAHWTVNAQRKLQAEIAVGKVISQINGLPIHQAMDHLKGTLPLAADAQIILFPEWWPRLPLLPTRILVLQPESK
jgi:hypothetical protein